MVSAWVMLFAAPLAAPTSSTSLEPCALGTPALVEVGALHAQVDDLVNDLKPGAPINDAIEALKRLASHPCSAFAVAGVSLPVPTSASALMAWWGHGGFEWLRPDRNEVVFPPGVRTWATEVPLRCRAEDVPCGAETAGWVRRAEAALRRGFLAAVQPIAEQCRGSLGDRTEPGAYGEWFTCVERALPVPGALPLGRFRAPSSGWLTVRGRRGHYDFCDEVRAYDLATGTAFIAQSCTGLAFGRTAVDFAATDAGRAQRVRMGRLNVENLREAAWMLHLLEHVERVRPEAATVPLPSGMRRVWRAPGSTQVHRSRRTISSEQTQLSWTWRGDATSGVLSGHLRWPDSSENAEEHAVRLLEIAEDSFIEGRPAARLPADWPPANGSAAVARRDADPARLDDVQRELVEAVRAASRNGGAAPRGR